MNGNQTKRVYLFVVLIWVLLISIIAAVIIQSSINSAAESFNRKVMNLLHLTNDQTRINETVVEGFAASVGVIGEINRTKIRIYAKQISQRYPHIFMFEIIEKVDGKNIHKFEADYQKNILSTFKIKSFGYGGDRTWHKLEKKDFYMPITFMEPFPPESQEVLGLDLNSNKFFIDSLRKSAKLHIPVVTRPFSLVEGDLAYLIHRPVSNDAVDLKSKLNDGIANRYVMLVILAKSLFKNHLIEMQDFNVTLYHQDFDKSEIKGHLYHQVSGKKSLVESILFPKLSLQIPLNSKTQPFVLFVEKQLGWEILNWWLLLVLSFVAGISFYVLIKYARIYHLSEINRLQEADNLFHLANHDSLTGLPNRNLLMDRLHHAVNQAERKNTKLAILFMDLNDFKMINDTYGHEIGDGLLKSVSERLLACIRNGDTLARRSGDEFILILENIEHEDNTKQIIDKIHAALERSFSLNEHDLKISISIGLALYPDDAKDYKSLLNIADKKMYENKG